MSCWQSVARNRPYHALFRLSDESNTGLVTLEAMRHTCNMMGATLTQDEAQMVVDKLAARADGMVDYEGLYRLLLETPPPQVFSSNSEHTNLSSLATARETRGWIQRVKSLDPSMY